MSNGSVIQRTANATNVMKLKLPPGYLPPDGLPFHWKGETSGLLRDALNAFRDWQKGNGHVDDYSLVILLGYCNHYIQAPAWSNAAKISTVHTAKLQQLKFRLERIKNAEDLNQWLKGCREITLDPFAE